jgi:ribokinase
MKLDLISIGDATLDTFIKLEEASVHCDLKKEACVLCLSYADKIAIPRPEESTGGNAANNAVGSARLGLKSAVYSVLGDDKTGHHIKELIKQEGVATDYLTIQPGSETNRSFILNFQGERTILVYHAARTYKLPKLDDATWIYLTSMGQGHLGVHDDLLAWLTGRATKLAFNPGTHQLKDGLEKLKPVLERTDLVFVNKEEAQRLVGDIKDMKELLRAMRQVGPKVVIITDGTAGSYAYDGQEFWHCGITGSPVVERTGAGDAFATGVLAAIFHGETIPEAMHWGTMNSGSVIGKVGPQAGLLNRDGMKEWLAKYPETRAEKI